MFFFFFFSPNFVACASEKIGKTVTVIELISVRAIPENLLYMHVKFQVNRSVASPRYNQFENCRFEERKERKTVFKFFLLAGTC